MKTRIKYLLITLVVMVMGLLSRKFMFIFPDNIAPFIGDGLWAMMVYFGLRFLFTKLKINKSFIIAISFCYLIEISQLYQADWINAIRATTLGGLVLGHGFLWADIISYTVGIIIGSAVDNKRI